MMITTGRCDMFVVVILAGVIFLMLMIGLAFERHKRKRNT